MTTCDVFVFSILLLIHKNLHRVLVPIAASISISVREVTNAQTVTLPKVMDAVIYTLLVYVFRSGLMLLCSLW